jgi:hypothetical protein
MGWTNWHTASLVVFLVCVLTIVAWDVFVVLFSPVRGATISYVVFTAARKSPVIALLIGIVVGHLVWPTLNLNPDKSETQGVENVED